jgi:GNAT superfamily N-acetyltransferase
MADGGADDVEGSCKTPVMDIQWAREDDVPLLLRFIRDLAVYERLEHEVVATEEGLRRTLFGEKRYAEALIARLDGEPVGFALFFHNYSTFVGKPGLYLEDLFVDPAHRGRGIGKALLKRLAAIAVERDCGRMEWAVLDWNVPSIAFYRSLGAVPLDDWTVFRLAGPALEGLAR